MSQAPKPEGTSAEAGSSVTITPKYPPECPPNPKDLGRATWMLLHTTAVWYPEDPSQEQREAMVSLLQSISILYPCGFCAMHLQGQLQNYPPDVSGRDQLSKWICDLHNRINQKLERPLFDPNSVFERWKDGPKDGSCAEHKRNH